MDRRGKSRAFPEGYERSSVRLSYTKKPSGTGVDVLDKNDYYPFGLSFVRNGLTETIFDPLAVPYNYKYNGKELQESGAYAMDWRHYMPDIGRFTGMDALSEVSPDWTPYRFAFNNPVMYADPSGLYEEIPGGYRITDPAEIKTFMGYLQNNSGASFDAMSSHITGSGLYELERYVKLDEVVVKGRKGGGFGEGTHNGAVMFSGILGALQDWNWEQNRKGYYEAVENCKACQEIEAVEQFLFMDLPMQFAGGAFLSAGWRAAGIGKLFAKTTGSLSESVASTFQFGKYSEVVLDKPIVLSRYYDNVSAFAKGRYMTDAISKPLLDRIGLAIKPSWNSMTKVASWEIPAGSTVYKGRAAMQFPWIGGKTQYFVPNLNNITRVMP